MSDSTKRIMSTIAIVIASVAFGEELLQRAGSGQGEDGASVWRRRTAA